MFKKLFLGLLAIALVAPTMRAEDTLTGGGWNVDIVTGTHQVISLNRVKLKAIVLSSGPTTATGDFFLQAFSTSPQIADGADGEALFPGPLFTSTAAVTPVIVYKTTTSVTSTGESLNNTWKIGDCENCYVETKGLIIRQSQNSLGHAGRAAVYWKK